MNQWISVKDRLPSHMRPCFCYDSNGNQTIAFVSNGRWLTDHIDSTLRHEIVITHWLEHEAPRIDPFEKWWDCHLPLSGAADIRWVVRPGSTSALGSVTKDIAKVIWDAAVESVSGMEDEDDD